MADKHCAFVIEDDPLALSILDHSLKAAGYRVVTATNAGDAIAMLEATASRVHILITDIEIGGSLTGWDLACFARTLNHSVPVLYLTATRARDFVGKSVIDSSLLLKPFSAAQVVDAVSQLTK